MLLKLYSWKISEEGIPYFSLLRFIYKQKSWLYTTEWVLVSLTNTMKPGIHNKWRDFTMEDPRHKYTFVQKITFDMCTIRHCIYSSTAHASECINSKIFKHYTWKIFLLVQKYWFIFLFSVSAWIQGILLYHTTRNQ